MRYRLCGVLKLFSHSIISMEGQQENEFADDMRGWAAHQKISGKTVDLLIKEGFDSMEALILRSVCLAEHRKLAGQSWMTEHFNSGHARADVPSSMTSCTVTSGFVSDLFTSSERSTRTECLIFTAL